MASPVRSGVAREGDEHRIDALLASMRRPDDELAAASAQARSRRRWLRQQAGESSTMAGVLLTLAEHEALVTLRSGAWTHQGSLRSVTESLVIVRLAKGVALLPTVSITAVEAALAVADDRVPAPGPDLAAVLATLVTERPRVSLLLEDGSEVAGTLTELGKDVASVRLRSSVATVRLSVVVGCILATTGSEEPGGPRDQDGESAGALGSADDFGSG